MGTHADGEPPRAVTPQDRSAVRHLVACAGVPAADVDDVTQEVLCALAFHRWDIEVSADRTPAQAREAFTAGVVKHQVARYRRDRARRRILLSRFGTAVRDAARPSVEELLVAGAPAVMLDRALARLRETHPEHYAVLSLAAGDVATPHSAAALLGIPASTASSRYRLGCRAVRAMLTRWAAEEASAAGRAAFRP